MWAYGDALSLVPHPDYVILCDEISEYHHKIQVPQNSKQANSFDI